VTRTDRGGDSGAAGHTQAWQVLWVLVRSDFRARYRAQALGVLWSLLNPIVMMGILSFVFTHAFRAAIPHFPIFMLIGLIVWQWVSSSLSAATQVFVAQAELVKRTVLPRELLPASVVLSYGLNFCVESLVLLAFVPIFPDAFRFSPALLLVPVLLFLLFLLLSAIALATSVLNVIYRDVAYLVSTSLLILYWLTPIIYPIDVIPQPYQTVLRCNPLAGVLIALRDAVMLGQAPSLRGWAAVILPIAFAGAVGWAIFRHYERMVLDYV
jgi:ABC-type polysaccharide/polyol phosphate export permease